MFQFSLFSSFIPYLAIAVMYVLYLGVFAFNKLSAESQYVDDESAESTVAWEPVSLQNTIRVSGDLFLTDDFNGEASLDFPPVSIPAMCRKLHEPTGELCVSAYLCFNLFSRPPPHIS